MLLNPIKGAEGGIAEVYKIAAEAAAEAQASARAFPDDYNKWKKCKHPVDLQVVVGGMPLTSLLEMYADPDQDETMADDPTYMPQGGSTGSSSSSDQE